jgi:hypothetical protein
MVSIFILSILLVPLFIFIVQPYGFSNDIETETVPIESNNVNDQYNQYGTSEMNSIFNSIETSTRSRAPDTETEPNNDITSAVNNNNKLIDNTDMEGKFTFSTDETDYFFIDLNGGGQSNIDRVNITPIFSDLTYLNDKAVALNLKAYTTYNNEPYLLEYKVLGTQQAKINDSRIPKDNSTSLFFNADRTGRYYINVSANYIIDSTTSTVIDPDALINYTLKVTVSSIPNPDNNNDPFNGTVLIDEKKNKTITQADDHWDWYKIDALTENRELDLSIRIKILSAETTDNDQFVNVYSILKCFDLVNNSWVEVRKNGDLKSKFTANPIDLSISATFKTAYIGIHSQQFEYEKYWNPNSMDCGESTINYDILLQDMVLINTKPELSNWNRSLKQGSLMDTYYFEVLYSDADNDAPEFVNITIDDVNYTMQLSTIASNDGDYINGELFEIFIQGSNFKNVTHTSYKKLRFYFTTQDYFSELELALEFVKLDPLLSISVIDNVRPSVKNNVPANWTLEEDSPPKFINLFSIFTDPDKKKYPNEVRFEVWLPITADWENKTKTENLTATVMDNNTLKIEPELHQFGVDFIRIHAYDIEGRETATEYEMEIIITPVNDKPVLIKPEEHQGKEDHFVNLSFQASDATDRYTDDVTISTDILVKIPGLAANQEKYQYKFDEITGELSFVPDNSMVGDYKINVTATDSGIIEPIGLSNTKQFTLTILNENDPPVANITIPKNNAKYNTSSIFHFSGINSTDDDLIHGDKLGYYWYLDTKENLLTWRSQPSVKLDTENYSALKDPGKHILHLKVKDTKDASSWTNITIWIISLVGDLPDGEDSDNDGMPDIWEIAYDLDPNKMDSDLDPDGDNLTNLQEFLGQDGEPGGGDSSDPTNKLSTLDDTDADQISDTWERARFGSLTQNKTGNPDGDDYTNYEEYLGPNGIPGDDDWSDPLDPKSIPVVPEKKSSDDDGLSFYLIAGIAIIIIIVLLIIIFMFVRTKKKKAEEEESSETKPFYTPEPMPGLAPMAPPGMIPTAPGQPGVSPGTGTIPMAMAQPMSTTSPPFKPVTTSQPPVQTTAPAQQQSTVQKVTLTTPPAAIQSQPVQTQTPPQQQTQAQQPNQQQTLGLPPSGQVSHQTTTTQPKPQGQSQVQPQVHPQDQNQTQTQVQTKQKQDNNQEK